MKKLIPALICLFLAIPCQAGVIYVDDDADVGGNGQTWGTAYKYLQDALDDAESGDEIWVAAGTYRPDDDTANHPDGTGLRTDTFQLINGVTLYGGFPSGGGTWQQRDPNAHDTILSGDLDGNDVDVSDPCDLATEPTRAENSHRVVTGNLTDVTAVLDGFTITGGNTSGGMHNFYGNPTVINCTFSSNSGSQGGGMLNGHSNPTLIGCAFRENLATSRGGGMFNEDSNPTLTNCTFSGNFAGLYGGGMNNWDYSNLTLTNCTFSGNSAGNSGGGIGNYENCNLAVTNCTFTGNSANYGGGFKTLGTSTLTNCTFSGNSAVRGGGIQSSYNSEAATLTNCIFWGNRDQYGAHESAQLQVEGTPPVINYSCIQGLTGSLGGTGNIGEDPLFVDADGPDGILGTEDDDLQLLIYSPCIDAGDNTAVPPSVTIDLGGNPRFIDIPWIQDSGIGSAPLVDMGAYETELQQSFIIVGDPVAVTEGDTGNFTVALALDPLVEVMVTVVFLEGDTDISVQSGEVMMFDSSDYSQPQTVTLAGGEDADFMNGTSLIRISASSIPSYEVTAVEVDNEPVPAVVFVDKNATGSNSGLSWTDALTYLQDALSAAADRPGVSQILVAEGNYKPDQGVATTPGDRAATFQLINGVAIKGGYAGVGAPDPNERDVELYETILSGDLNGDDVNVSDPCDLLDETTRAENSYHVITGNGTDVNAVLDGFTITAGNAYNSYSENCGGGMVNELGNPTVSNCTFNGNSAGSGGGMWNYESSPTLTNCTFKNNSGGTGGGMTTNYSNPTLTNCTIADNQSFGFGGGMWNANGNPVLTNCTFKNNSAALGGGMINYGNPTLTKCIFSGNSANEWDGGGIANAGDPNLTNCTFTGNSANEWGGGIYNALGSPRLTNCILWDNTSPMGSQIKGSATVSYSDVQDGWPGEGNIDDDPCFVEPGRWVDANDPNIVVEPNDPNAVWIDGDYHLKSESWRWDSDANEWTWDDVTSRCIDAGNPGSPLGDEPLTLDVDPLNRWGENIRINMGAYGGTAEASMPPYDWTLLSDITNDGTVDFVDFAHVADMFGDQDDELPGDFDRDSDVDYADLFLLTEDWLRKTTWHE